MCKKLVVDASKWSLLTAENVLSGRIDLMQLFAMFPNFCIDRPFGFSVYRDGFSF